MVWPAGSWSILNPSDFHTNSLVWVPSLSFILVAPCLTVPLVHLYDTDIFMFVWALDTCLLLALHPMACVHPWPAHTHKHRTSANCLLLKCNMLIKIFWYAIMLWTSFHKHAWLKHFAKSTIICFFDTLSQRHKGTVAHLNGIYKIAKLKLYSTFLQIRRITDTHKKEQMILVTMNGMISIFDW